MFEIIITGIAVSLVFGMVGTMGCLMLYVDRE